MTLGGLPRACLLVAAMVPCSLARAGVWVSEPVLGLTADYSSNPALLYTNQSAETRGAVLLDAPTTYHADALSVALQPSLRLGNSAGYSSLTSDYARFTASGEMDSERNSLTVTGQTSRDSSLYYNYGLNGSTGVRRDTVLVDAAWLHALTERLNVNTELTSSRVQYGDSHGYTTLTDYRYTTAAPTLSWNAGERTSLTLSGDSGLYDSADGATKSLNFDFQIGMSRQLSELWTLKASAGYSREINSIDEYYGPYLLGSVRSTTTGTVFTGNATRQGERLVLSFGAKRSLVPSGFAFLARQDSYQAAFRYPYTARWSLEGHVGFLRSVEPQVSGPTANRSYLDLGLSATCLLTEKWTLTLRGSRLSAKYTPPTIDVTANGFTAQLSRRFDPLKWH
jgi:hypothetical protein